MRNTKPKIDWGKVRIQFENDMRKKLEGLPDHRTVPENLKEFRSIIPHELPETSSFILFQKLIKILNTKQQIDIKKILNEEIKKENAILQNHKKIFDDLKLLAEKWMKNNLSEKKLHNLWKDHKTWLPRRFTIYKNNKPTFQKIASDTLARYYLIEYRLLNEQ